MNKDKKEDEATDKVNAPETTEEEASSEKENLETSEKEDKVEVETEKIEKDYLEEEEPEVDYKKRYGDSTREYQTLKEKTDNLNTALENLESLARLNPKIASEIEEAKRLSGEAGEGSPTGTLIQQQIDKSLEPVKKVAQDIEKRERLSKVKVLANFEKKNPKLFSPKATEKEKTMIRQRIGKVANTLVETGMDFPDAVNRAYLTVNPKAAVQKGKDKAYLEGLDEEQAGFSSQTTSEGKKPTKTRYSNKELKIGDKMGVGKAMRKDK